MIIKSLGKKLTYTLESVKTFMEMIQYQKVLSSVKKKNESKVRYKPFRGKNWKM